MIIEDGIKLDFKDVLFKPMRSTLRSRSEVDLERTMKFRHSPHTWTGVPIMSANMDTTGTFEMAEKLMKYNMVAVIHKHYSVEDWNTFVLNEPIDTKRVESLQNFVVPSIGASDEDLEKYRKINAIIDFKFVCIDVANGYGEWLSEFVGRVRQEFPDKIIIAGNVVSGDMTQELIMSGADVVKVGIGPGCFTPGTKVITRGGEKNIEDVIIGDVVQTHTGDWQDVTNTFKYDNDGEIMSVNGIKSTKSHEYYVIEKQYKDILTDENIHEYAKWIPAGDLDKDRHFLIKHR